MPTLNKTKKDAQIIFKWGGISLAIIFLFFIGIRFLSFVRDFLTPSPPPQASFGQLLPISFPNQQKENVTYTLNTLTGFLPSFPDRAKVYKISPDQPTLLGLNKAREKAAQAGFKAQETQITQDVYQFSNQDSNLQRKITINIFSSDFTVSSPFLAAPSLQRLTNSYEKDNAIKTARSFLADMSLFPEDIDENKTKTSIYLIERGTLIPTSKISSAKIVRVDFFQKDIDRLPIYYELGITSTIDLLIGKENAELKVVDARYFHKNISEVSSTYPIKTAFQAFLELQKGKAYIAHKPAGTVEFTIKKVFLGYYIGELEQEFLMPVVIFEGDNDFVAYVSAVRDEWISN